jgi:predicted GNAT family N-acyltransferase
MPSLDRYLQQQAGQDVKKRVTATFVLPDVDGRTVLGYYTLSATSLHLTDLPPDLAKKLPKYPRVPATLLGRLAVSRQCQGMGLGEHLLMDALHRSWQHSRTIGSMAVVVDANDARAVTFYQRYGFLRFPDQPHRLFLPMHTIAQLFP